MAVVSNTETNMNLNVDVMIKKVMEGMMNNLGTNTILSVK
jgi:hypothetical protein